MERYERYDNIKKLLTSQFEIELFEAALHNLDDQSNRLKYNNFAYSIRELSRHFLYSLSPEEKVKKCKWYIKETDDGKLTRAQRVKYAIHGGVINEILEEWGFSIEDLNETIKAIIGEISALSKYTHINPDVFGLDDNVIKKSSEQVLDAFEKFVETIDNYRKKLKDFLDGHIEDHMVGSVVSNFFENIDSIAPHYSLNYSDVSDYYISEITDFEIIVNVSGYLHVTLEYGSRKERREGDGLDIEENFPYKTKIRYEISEDFPSDNHEIDDYDVDISQWFGDDEIN